MLRYQEHNEGQDMAKKRGEKRGLRRIREVELGATALILEHKAASGSSM